MAKTRESAVTRFAEFRKIRNVVFRDVRDRNGIKIGALLEPHDGSETGIILAARRVTDRMYAEYSEASNIESRLGATDGTGTVKWSVSPNFQSLAEIETDEARYIWGTPLKHKQTPAKLQ